MLFISHSSNDNAISMKLVKYLETNGIACWIAPRDILSGSSYPTQIIQAIRKCTGFVLIASDHINRSNHINTEVARAFD